MLTFLRYLTFLGCLGEAALSGYALYLMAGFAGGEPAPYPLLAMLAIQAMLYGLAVYEIARSSYRTALIYTLLCVPAYAAGLLYMQGPQGLLKVPLDFYIGMAIRAALAMFCYILMAKQRPAAQTQPL